MRYETYNWVAILIEDKTKPEEKPFVKILAQIDIGMNGWRINSGVDKVEEDENEYRFIGSSGSIYACSKNEEGLSRTTSPIFSNMTAKIVDENIVCEIISGSEVKKYT